MTETPKGKKVPGKPIQVASSCLAEVIRPHVRYLEAHLPRIPERVARLLERVLGGLHRKPPAARVARRAKARRDQSGLQISSACLRDDRGIAERGPLVLDVERGGPDRLPPVERHEVTPAGTPHEQSRPFRHPFGKAEHALDDPPEGFRVL